MKLKRCRICNAQLTKTFVNLGNMPLANAFLKKNIVHNEPMLPLHAYVCSQCFLVQLEKIEEPKNIFLDYAYFSSYSKTWLKHSKDFVDKTMKKFRLNSKSLVIEIASNDGYLLQYFKKFRIPVLGIEPAVNVAKIAQEKEIPTITKFFGTKLASELKESGKIPRLLIANNVLAHVPEVNDFVEGLKIILDSKGIITIEFPHLLQLIEKNQFDTIYHEHFSYFSLITAKRLFTLHSLEIFDVEEIPTHGGSLRIYVKHKENKNIKRKKSVNRLIKKEKLFGLTKLSTYTNFSKKTKLSQKRIVDFLVNAKNAKKIVVGYGAPAKGNTLLNYCKANSELIRYTVDMNPHKQGLYLPGTHISIRSPQKIFETKPDYVLILPWNLKNEIMRQMKDIRRWGGKFVVPIPEVRIYR